MVDAQPGSPRTLLTDEEVSTRVEELLQRMTVAEKAGQLTQYFYFGSVAETAENAGEPGDATADAGEDLGAHLSQQPAMVQAALSRGETGSLLFVTDPAETNRLQS